MDSSILKMGTAGSHKTLVSIYCSSIIKMEVTGSCKLLIYQPTLSVTSQKNVILIFTAMTTSNNNKLFVLFGNKFWLRCMNFFTDNTYKFYSLWILRSLILLPKPIHNLLSFHLLSENIQLILYYFAYKTHIFHNFSHWKIEVHLQFEELFTSLQTVHRVAWKEPNIYTFKVSHHTTSSPPQTFSSVIARHYDHSGVFSFLLVFIHGKAFYIWWCIQIKSRQVIMQLVESIQ
jgi:hypothetical protein